MATVTGFTAARMAEIESQAVVGAEVVGDNLVMERHDTSTFLAGNVRGPQGPSVEAGVVAMFAGATAPTGFLMCDGAAVSRTTYATLFGVIGVTYGAGNGSTTFNVPDLRNRFPVGKGTATWSDSLNEKGGSADAIVVSHTHTGPSHTHTGPSHTHTGPSHTHSTPAHTHTDNFSINADGSHYHTLDSGYYFVGQLAETGTGGVEVKAGTAATRGATSIWATGYSPNHTHTILGSVNGGGAATTGSGGTQNTGASGTGATSASGTGATGSTGSAATNANLPPYISLNFIIKT